MTRIIEAKAVISAEDRTGKAFDAISRRFKEMGKSEKVAASVGKLGKEIDRAASSLKQLENFRGVQTAFSQARSTFRGAQGDVARIAKELDNARRAAAEFSGIRSFSRSGGIAKELDNARRQVVDLERQFVSAQRAVKAASTSYESHTAALKGVKAEISGSGQGLGKLIAEEHRLKAAVEGATGAIRRQEQLLHAEGRLATGMGAAGRRQAAQIAQSRYLTEGMGSAGRAARAEHEAHLQSQADARAQRRADRRDAAGTIAAGTGLYLGHKGKEIGLEAINSAARMDYAVRYQHIATDVSEATQQRLLLPQAKRIGQETKFSNEDVVEAQTSSMQGLPYKDPELKAKVGASIVEYARAYAVLFKSSLPGASETLRSFLQNANKDISTPEKAEFEARRGTNLIVKAAKLGGMNDEDAQHYTKFGIPTATQAGFNDVTGWALGSVARRSGLRGDEAGVFVRAASSKLISPTREGREAEIMAGIDRSKYQKMPEQLSEEAFEKIGKGRFGLQLSKNQRGRLGAMFRDGDLLQDEQEFTKRVSGVVSESFEKKKDGKLKAQDAQKIAKLASQFYRMSVESTDVQGLLDAHMNSPTFTAALRNKFYTDKHGGKAGILAQKFDQFKEDREALEHVTQEPNFASDRAKYMTKGLGGSIDNLKGSYETAVLNLGTKNAGAIQTVADGLAAFGDAIANLPDQAVQAGTALALLGGSAATAASALTIMGKLTGSTAMTTAGGTIAGATFTAAPLLAGVAAGAYLDTNFGGNTGALGLLTGQESDHQRSMRYLRERGAGDAAAASLGYGAPRGGGVSLPAEVGAVDPAAGYASEYRISRGAVGDFLWGQRKEQQQLPGFGGGAKMMPGGSVPVTITSMPPGIDLSDAKSANHLDPSGQLAAQANTLDKAATASATAANGGKPIEATVKPDQITAKITEIPPVTGSVTETVTHQHQHTISLNTEMLRAEIRSVAAQTVKTIPLSQGGGRAGATSMPGAALTPGAAVSGLR